MAESGIGVMGIFVRLAGIGLLIVGLWTAIEVIKEAWDLYRDPAAIERFARAIDKGSNLDKLVAPSKQSESARASGLTDEQDAVLPQDNPTTKSEQNLADNEALRLSYFVAWIIVLLLLMLIARIALSAIKTGGELALYDMQIKKFAQTLIRETIKSQRAS
ncbi:MAG: hypothetical protein L0Z68_07505 [Gammaproteobacteria bacterium]|nr:hypothetical protein [Gammaproteobacteria bacterium]